jgi:hypothetical protein
MSGKIEQMPPRRPLQARLPLSADQGDAATSSSTQAAKPSGMPCLDPGDPDAYLDALSDADLRWHVDELKAASDIRDVIGRLLMAIGVLEHRGLLATPRGARCALADVPAARPWRSAASARRRLLVLLRRIGPGSSPAHAEALAEFLAEDLVDSGSIGRFRTIAGGIREGLVAPGTVRAAYKAAKKPGARKPGSLLWSYVVGRSPGLARAHAMRREPSRYWFQ